MSPEAASCAADATACAITVSLKIGEGHRGGFGRSGRLHIFSVALPLADHGDIGCVSLQGRLEFAGVRADQHDGLEPVGMLLDQGVVVHALGEAAGDPDHVLNADSDAAAAWGLVAFESLIQRTPLWRATGWMRWSPGR